LGHSTPTRAVLTTYCCFVLARDDPKHAKDFTALVNLPPGPHSLKFIIDKQWKTSKYLPSATDADGNLINYLQVR
jgi:hypothetical protein